LTSLTYLNRCCDIDGPALPRYPQRQRLHRILPIPLCDTCASAKAPW
jgi:hypothetical protein